MALGLLDFQVNIGGASGVTMGPTTPYLIMDYQGLGVPDVRSQDVPRAMQHGDWLGQDFLASRTVTLSVTITGTSAANARANLNALLGKWLSPDGTTLVPLAVKLPGQEECVFQGRPRRAPADLSRLQNGIVPITLEFYTADPRLFSNSPASGSTAVGTSAGGRAYPLVFARTYGGSGTAGGIICQNNGNITTPPTWTITGPCVNPSIQNSTTGEALSFGITLAAGDQLVIDVRNRSVLLNGVPRRSALVAGSKWFDLPPGTTNITYTASSAVGSMLSVAYASAWVG